MFKFEGTVHINNYLYESIHCYVDVAPDFHVCTLSKECSQLANITISPSTTYTPSTPLRLDEQTDL